MITRRFIVLEVCTVDRRPHALNSEQRLWRARRFSPTATWPLPPLSQLERERSQSLQNAASTRHQTLAITNLLIADVGTAGRDKSL